MAEPRDDDDWLRIGMSAAGASVPVQSNEPAQAAPEDDDWLRVGTSGGAAPSPSPAPAPPVQGESRRQPPSRLGAVGAFGQGLTQGASLGWGDELNAGIGRLTDKALGTAGYTGPRQATRGMGADYDTRTPYERYLDEERARLRQVQDEYGSAFMAGDIVGTIGVGLIPGGALARPLGTAARIGLGAAEGAAVGAVEGAGRTEGDRMQGAAEGALYGAAGGAALPAAAATGRAAWEGGKRVAGVARDLLTSNLDTATQRAVREMTSAGPEGARARAALLEAERGSDALARDIGEGLTAQREFLDVATNTARTSMKKGAAERMLAEGGYAEPTAIHEATARPLASIREVLGEAMSDVKAYPNQGTAGIKKTLQQIDAWEFDAIEGLSRGDSEGVATAFDAYDKIKRQAQRLTANARDRGFKGAMDDATEPLRQMLESPDLWGARLGAEQRELNQAWRAFLGRDDALKSRFYTDLGDLPVQGADPYGDKLVGDIGKIEGVISGADRGGAQQSLHVLERGTQEQQRLVDRLGSMYDVPQVQQLAQRSADVTGRIQGQIGQIREGARLRGALGTVAQEGLVIPGARTLVGGIRTAGRVEAAGRGAMERWQRHVSRSPNAYGAFTTVLARAAQRGPEAFAAAHYVLAQQNPEFRALDQRLAEVDAEQENGR